jgi:hypothetical protein
MGSQVKIAGWIYVILGGMGFLSALCSAAIIFSGGLVSGDETTITTTGIIASVMVGLSFFIFDSSIDHRDWIT